MTLLTKKFDDFQTNVNTFMTNTNAKMVLMENSIKMIKSQVSSKNNESVLSERPE